MGRHIKRIFCVITKRNKHCSIKPEVKSLHYIMSITPALHIKITLVPYALHALHVDVSKCLQFNSCLQNENYSEFVDYYSRNQDNNLVELLQVFYRPNPTIKPPVKIPLVVHR